MKSLDAEFTIPYDATKVMLKLSMAYSNFDLELLEQTGDSFSFKKSCDDPEHPLFVFVLVKSDKMLVQVHGVRDDFDIRTLTLHIKEALEKAFKEPFERITSGPVGRPRGAYKKRD